MPTQFNTNNDSSYVMPDSPKGTNKNSFLRELLPTLGILGSAFGMALLLIAFVFQSYAVDGPSMEITLDDKDRLLVWKLPHTWSNITNNQYIPARGDVVVFHQSSFGEGFGDSDRQLIKRVIGLPGDRVVVKDGTITVYNNEHPEGFQPDKTLPYSRETKIPYTSGADEWVVGEDEVFVCGDNRPESLDSRAFGPIKTDQLVGKLVARILPIGKMQIF